MPNEFDKILNERLEGYEASFNPADWQRMEALLPQDSRKFFFVIAGLFALLFVATSALMMNNLLNSSADEKTFAVDVSQNGKISDAEYRGLKYAQNKAETSEAEQSESVEAKDESVNTPAAAKADLKTSSPANAPDYSAAPEAKTKSEKTQSGASGVANERELKRKNKAATGTVIHPVREGHRMNNGVARTTADSQTAEMLARINADMIGSSASEEPKLPSLEGMESLTNKKGKVFEFGLGLLAGANISFIDAAYLTKPGYAVGIAQELMFVNRVGLVLSESYAVAKYDGGSYPCPSGYANCPNGYSSDVKSFNLGIDLKVNIIQKPQWNWYAKAGVTNAFKIEELFEFRYPDMDTVAPPPVPSTQTNFNGSNDASFEDALGVTAINAFAPNPEPLPDLTISGAKRFHPAYHFAAGFDVKLSARVKLQFETGYSFTKPTVGPDDKRLHTIGLNGGFFYTFAK